QGCRPRVPESQRHRSLIPTNSTERSAGVVAPYTGRPLQSDGITLQGGGVTIADVIAVARGQRRVVLGDDARSRVVAARSIVDRLASSDVPIYGVNTALGANTGAHI